MELARYYKRLENIEKRKQENERHTKNGFMVWVSAAWVSFAAFIIVVAVMDRGRDN